MNFTNTAPGVHVPSLMIICKIMFVYYWVCNMCHDTLLKEFAKKQCRHPHANIVTQSVSIEHCVIGSNKQHA